MNTIDRLCSRCGKKNTLTHFKLVKSLNEEGMCTRCEKDTRYQRLGCIDRYAHSLWMHYKMTMEEYEQLRSSQGNACAICLQIPLPRKRIEHLPELALYVDHSHSTGLVRGLLCNRCNAFLSKVENDPEWIDKAKSYLAKYNN